MLEGERPSECEYCWKIEDLKKGHLSDRFIKSFDPWAWPKLDDVAKMPWDKNVIPTYLEVMFDNICNLSCSYCMADVSTMIQKEMEKFGPYPVKDQGHRMPRNLPKSEKYVEAFWKWLPEIFSKLHYLRITGGEPFLSPQVDKLLDYIEKEAEPSPNLTLAINSNLMIQEKKLNEKIEKLVSLKVTGKIKELEIYTSLEAKGPAAEYIRPGLDYSIFFKNLEEVCSKLNTSRVVVMATFNILSVTSFKDFCIDILELKKKYSKVVLDISYLKDPTYLRANLITENEYLFLDEVIEFMESYLSEEGTGFSVYECNKFKRVVDWVKKESELKEIENHRSDFYLFINEYDKRKNLNFSSTFPELKSLYILSLKSEIKKRITEQQVCL